MSDSAADYDYDVQVLSPRELDTLGNRPEDAEILTPKEIENRAQK